MHPRFARFLFIAAAVCLLVSPAGAQTSTGNIYGKVVDQAGDPLPGVTVAISGVGAPQTFISEADGGFRFLRLSPGRYNVAADLSGFSTVRRAVDVNLGANSEVTLSLAPEMRETVTVTAATPLIDTRETGTSEVVSQEELEQLPTARDPWVMLQQMPGVLVDRVNVGGSKSGQQSYFVSKGVERHQTTWNIDGVNVTEMDETGTTTFYYDFGSLQEFQVVTSGADPAARTPGAQVNMVTKRGTNAFAGSARVVWADEALQADPALPGSIREGNSVDNVTELGADFGGPILADKLWFYGAYGQNDIGNITFAYTFPQKTSLTNWTAKLDAQPLSNNTLTAYYMFSDKTVNARGLSATRPPETARRQSGPGWVAKLEDTHIFSSNFIVTGLYAKVDSGYVQEPRGGMGVEPIYIGESDNPFNLARGWHGSYSRSEQVIEQNNYRLDGSAFFRSGSIGHEVKFGAGYRDAPTEWNITWPGNQVWGEFWEDGNLAAFTRQAHPIYTGEYTDLYVGDTMTFGNLTVQGGLRYDLQRSFNQASSVAANPVIPDILVATSYPGDERKLQWETITPKLGATYTFGQNSRTLLRGSYARYADQLGSSDAGANNPFYDYQLIYYNWDDMNGDRRVQRDEVDFSEMYDWVGVDPDNLAAGAPSNGRVDYDNHDPTMTDEFLAGIQHEFRPGLAVGVNYTYRKRDNFIWTQYEKTRGMGDFYTAEDYVPASAPITGTLPDGTPYSIPYYNLRTGVPRAQYYATRNRPDYHQTYNSVELSAQLRTSDKWSVRGQATFADWKQHVGPRGVQDPSPLLQGDGCYTCDGSAVASSSGADGYINARWSYSLTGLYQLPWQFNVGAVITGREGYINGLNRRVRGADRVFRRYVIPEFDDHRFEDLFQVDLRLAKELGLRRGVNLELAVDAFNVTNERTVLWQGYEYVANQSAPTAPEEIQSPRLFRLGARVRF